ncbi:hypothetical protein LEP1GSC185_0773 [Leptospira licerasiae serovar Varillal str. VAR 010]|uniref:Uncharacterized protein n=1 Tax=Leptospira licerasiae str. MMD4847 TaxID=1049971 RepID=A0ABN0HAS8_9LEPT|nr:hypothetical protein LEP1GSC185_0773 [Leptospira licerasiae serovar Varillal str. VAR 010]EJZ42858.1 hypothetical protein LEP1GSC178_3778 [Leptospira licerasiae str. MMD4847]
MQIVRISNHKANWTFLISIHKKDFEKPSFPLFESFLNE